MSFRQCLYTFLDSRFELSEPAKLALMGGLIFACIAISYMLGSLNFAVIISKLRYHDDIREHGSGNAGTTNMLRTYGKGAAALTLAGDMLKCAVAVIIGALLWIDGSYIAGLFCVIGHVFPCWYKFKGGKGIAPTAIVVLLTSPVVFAVLLIVFAIVLIGTKFVSLASIMCALLYPVLLSSWNTVADNEGSINVIMAFLLTALILIMHRGNIKRLLDKTEPKTELFKKKKKAREGELADMTVNELPQNVLSESDEHTAPAQQNNTGRESGSDKKNKKKKGGKK